MTDPQQTLEALLQAAGTKPGLLSEGSRYYGLPVLAMELNGRTVKYFGRRLLPDPDTLALLQEHEVAQGERLDHVAARYLGDAEQFWRLCDANGAMRPVELEEIGRRLRITLPEGIRSHV